MNLTIRQIRELEQAVQQAGKLKGSAAMRARQRAVEVYSKQAKSLLKTVTTGATSGFVRELSKSFGGSAINPLAKEFTQALAGGAADELKAQVVRYARGGLVGSFLGSFLKQAGPVGQAMSMLLGRGKSANAIPDSAIANAIQLLSSLGFEVRLPSGGGLQTHVKTGAKPPKFGRAAKDVVGLATEPPESPTLPKGRFVANQYVPMALVHGSTNVYAIGYAPSEKLMRVQYLGNTVNAASLSGRGHKGKSRVRGQLGRTVTNKRRGPGSVYDYFGVPQSVFDRIQNAPSKGSSIWDNLRVRGTVFGSRYDYRLSAGSMVDVVLPALDSEGRLTAGKKVGRVTYIPRRATGPGMFQARTMKQGTSTFTSLLPSVGMRGFKG